MAIVAIPTAISSVELEVWKETPNKVLYNILTHNVQEQAANYEIRGGGEDSTWEVEDDICRAADLSPRITESIKSAKKAKHQMSVDWSQPSKVLPKRNVVSK